MSEETQAASSPAEVEDVFKGEHVSLAEFSKYRQDGELPERFKPAEAADAPEETVESEAEEPEPASESEPEETQEPPQKGAEKRIKQLLAKTKELERQLAEKQDVKPASSPVKPAQPIQAANYDEWQTKFIDEEAPKWMEQWAKDNPDKLYESGNAAMFRYMRTVERQFEQQAQAQQALQSKLDEARARYEDADDAIFPAAKSINDAKIPQVVKEVFAQSDSYIDLCYVVGSDPDELKKFISLAQTNPRAAIGKVFEYERGIKEELSKGSSTLRDDKGKFTSKEAPEVKKTSAPKPPSPVGGASTRAFDVSDESLSPEEWARKRNQDVQKRGR